jgi:hypothetical protein
MQITITIFLLLLGACAGRTPEVVYVSVPDWEAPSPAPVVTSPDVEVDEPTEPPYTPDPDFVAEYSRVDPEPAPEPEPPTVTFFDILSRLLDGDDIAELCDGFGELVPKDFEGDTFCGTRVGTFGVRERNGFVVFAAFTTNSSELARSISYQLDDQLGNDWTEDPNGGLVMELANRRRAYVILDVGSGMFLLKLYNLTGRQVSL